MILRMFHCDNDANKASDSERSDSIEKKTYCGRNCWILIHVSAFHSSHLPAHISLIMASNSLQKPRRRIQPATQQRGQVADGVSPNRAAPQARGAQSVRIAYPVSRTFLMCMVIALIYMVFLALFVIPEYLFSGSGSGFHIPHNIRLGHSFVDEFDTKPLLLIGGSDGSGTRSFVDAIKKVGVTVIADDKDTFDVHAAPLFNREGWPALVNLVLKETHSGNYQWEDLPQYTREVIDFEMTKFVKSTRARYKRLREFEEKSSQVTAVAYAMKAPVSMLILPIMARYFSPKTGIKFIHVVRDGRDVALSSNQSPVIKFYNNTYPDHANRSLKWKGDLEHVKAMQLWNDWNLQVNKWGIRNPDQVDYLLMRSEDLLDPEKRFECLQRLAEFVGSTLSIDELCCMSDKVVDFGKSTVIEDTAQIPKFVSGGQRWGQMGGNMAPPVFEITSLRNIRQNEVASEFTALEHRTQDREDKLRKRESEMNEREASLKKYEQSLKQRSAKLHEQDEIQDSAQGASNSSRKEAVEHRRLLSEAKMVPTMFLRQHEAWKRETNLVAGLPASELDYPKVQSLISGGASLKERYFANEEALKSQISIEEILQIIKHLEKLAAEIRRNPQIDNHSDINKRYGRWRTFLENRTELSKHLHEEGMEGLRFFGYRPREAFSYPTNVTAVCNVTALNCGN
jgi:hypothetical protein